jgi:hypothetical protein
MEHYVGAMLLDFPVSRAIRKQTSVVYSSPSLWRFVTAAEKQLRQPHSWGPTTEALNSTMASQSLPLQGPQPHTAQMNLQGLWGPGQSGPLKAKLGVYARKAGGGCLGPKPRSEETPA